MSGSGNKAFLFAWNPTKWNWTTLKQQIEEIEKSGYTSQKWSIVSYRKVKPGDRAFLMRLGKEPKGIMGSGVVKTDPFLTKHWSGADKMVYRVIIEFDVLLNPDQEPLLNLELLKSGNLSKLNWTPQSSGIEIANAYIDELEAFWFKFLTSQNIYYNLFQINGSEEQKIYTEGTPNKINVTRYERNPFARKICIDHYGLSCVVCGFNFEEVYGEIGRSFIHVHHLCQIATIGKKSIIDPIKDLRPVCPNCHVMIHQRKEPFTIAEMKKKICNKRLNC